MPDVLVSPSCRSFFQQLVMAVDFCHSMGIPVRDLRPHNLLLLEPNDAPSLCRCVHMPTNCLHAHLTQSLHGLLCQAGQSGAGEDAGWLWQATLSCT